jgi:hypothetical protein
MFLTYDIFWNWGGYGCKHEIDDIKSTMFACLFAVTLGNIVVAYSIVFSRRRLVKRPANCCVRPLSVTFDDCLLRLFVIRLLFPLSCGSPRRRLQKCLYRHSTPSPVIMFIFFINLFKSCLITIRKADMSIGLRDIPASRVFLSMRFRLLRYVSENITLPIERDNTTWNLASTFLIYTVVGATRNSPEIISTKFLFIIFSEIDLRLKGVKPKLVSLS